MIGPDPVIRCHRLAYTAFIDVFQRRPGQWGFLLQRFRKTLGQLPVKVSTRLLYRVVNDKRNRIFQEIHF